MLRITEDKPSNDLMILRVDGCLAGEWVEVLGLSCERACENDRGLSLDLAGVSFADRAGVQLLRRLEHRKVKLINRSAFLREQMNHLQRNQDVEPRTAS